MFYKLIIACGHMGRGREIEVTRYFEAASILEAWESALQMPRAKKGFGGCCIRKIERINLMQYLAGKIDEAENPYLQVVRLAQSRSECSQPNRNKSDRSRLNQSKSAGSKAS